MRTMDAMRQHLVSSGSCRFRRLLIEQLSKYDLVIDLPVERELGLNVPPKRLLRAYEVIG